MDKEKLLIQLEPKSISACSNIPPELAFMGSVLQHQADVFEKARTHDIILDEAPTGTGKTQASLSVLLHQPNKSAVYIAPTNALITQQTLAAEVFVRQANLPHVVKAASAKEIKAWSDVRVGKRSGEKLYNVLRNPATIFPEVGGNRPILLVTNPDIFYYATFFAYSNLDKNNVASVFYSKLATVIFDEFHLYSAKQLVGLLFYLAHSHVFGFFKAKRRVVLLTATPDKACELALKFLQEKGVKIAKITENNPRGVLLPSQVSVNLEIRPQLDKDELLEEIASEVEKLFRERPDKNGAVILDSKDSINKLRDLLVAKGLKNYCGRITGSTPLADRLTAVQKSIILATSTVDVGFNFEKKPGITRQNLDWLIFSTRDRFSFWQRLGRVGRVLGKAETNIPSDAIAYLPDKAWSQGITSLDPTGGRKELTKILENLSCLERPFLDIYWRSEAFLEIARPLSELEEMMEGLAKNTVISELYDTLKSIFGGKREWNYYRYRMKVLRGAEQLAKTSLVKFQKDWKYIKGGQAFVRTFIKANCPEDWEDLNNGVAPIEEYEKIILEDSEIALELKKFANIWRASHAPIFQFRDSIFENLLIKDPKALLLDDSEETTLDPIHLLRYYEFIEDGKYIIVSERAKTLYQLNFRWRYRGSREEFKNQELNKLNAFENCHIERKMGGSISPTPLLKVIEKNLLPGVIIPTAANQGTIFQLRKQGIADYLITVVCDDLQKDYTFYPSLSGILAVANSGVRFRLPDDEDFYII
ncbi:MAG: type I-D CRISPR-associated helicase Cas3' [Prochloraceae cyanobacterium]|nr:type I-D CRISPR-associated helicase Cas3' [Prochloraceae cyanobacterium]